MAPALHGGNLNSSEPFEVVIVGFGPSGAVAASWLGQWGVRTLVIDKSAGIWDIPRAIALDHEIMRVFQNLGVVREIEPYTAPFPASEHYGVQGQLIRRVDIVPPPNPLGYHPTLVFTQPEVERVLREHVATLPSVNVELECELVGLEQSSDRVTAAVRRGDGSDATVHSKFLIACDGASSRVRQQAGLELKDLGFDEPWMVVDVIVKDEALSKLPATAAQFCNPARPTTFIVGPGNHRRWEIMLLPDEDPREMEQEQNVWRLLAPWLSAKDGRLWRASSYRFHALVAENWRNKRVFLAGDAAHQQPPFIGQGMCQGIRDVTNLAWKLKAVLSGAATESLLESYGAERKEHVETLTNRIKTIGRHICERDVDAAQRRDEELIRQGGGAALTVTRQEIVPPMTTGLLSRRSHEGTGTIFPQPWIVDAAGSGLLDERVEFGWWLVLDGRRIDVYDMDAHWVQVVKVGGNGLRERDGVVASWFDRNNAVAALVRPDHYVFGTACCADEIAPLLVEARTSLVSIDSTGM